MVMKRVVRKTLCKLATPVLEKKTPRFLDQVEHWLENKGEEWLSERWKVIRNAAYLVRSGKPEDAVELMLEKGIAVRDDKPVSRGPFGSLQLAYLQAESPYQIRSCEALLRGYTGITLTTETRKQVVKAEKAITGPSTSSPQDTLCIALSKDIPKGLRYLPKSVLKEYSPDARGISGIRTYYTGIISVPSKLRSLPFASAMVSAVTVGAVPESVLRLCGDNPIRRKANMFQESQNQPNTFGKISFLQEGGCKARVICLPSFWMQAYYKPLQDELIRRIGDLEMPEVQKRMLGISCVLDQNRGAYILQKWMKEGRELFSFDLSSATDRFPLSYQLDYLKVSGLDLWHDPVRDAARGKYYLPKLDQEWTYSVGQPMGLNFSFPLFHLSHQTLLESLARITTKSDYCYAVLGDDVLVSDKDLAVLYKRTLEKLGVEISKEKSLEGLDVQTFAGFTGVTSSRGLQVFRPFKHGPDFAIQGKELNVLSTFGPKVRKWSGWWSRSFDQLSRTFPLRNPDLSPVLSSSDEGELRSGNPGSRWFSAVTSRVISEDLFVTLPSPKGGFKKHKVSLPFLGETEWNRVWGTLLREKEPVLTSSFDIKQYITEERMKTRTCQVSSDPLIKDQKRLDKVLDHLRGTVEKPGNRTTKSLSLGR